MSFPSLLGTKPFDLESKYVKFDMQKLFKDSQSEISESETESEAEPMNHSNLFFIDKVPSSNAHVCPKPVNIKRKVQGTSLRVTHGPSELQTGNLAFEPYLEIEPDENPGKATLKLRELTLATAKDDKLLEKSVITAGFEQKHSIPPYMEGKRETKRKAKIEREKTKGPSWFNMKAPELTEEAKMDLEILAMRNSLDTKRFYKKNDRMILPKYFQVGTVIESPADFYHSRIPKKDRKQTIVEELLADAEFRKINKKKYAEAMKNKPKSWKEKKAEMKKKKRRSHKTGNQNGEPAGDSSSTKISKKKKGETKHVKRRKR